MRRVFIEVEDAAFRTIADAATAERRPTRDQIAILVEQAAKRLARRREAVEQAPRHAYGAVGAPA